MASAKLTVPILLEWKDVEAYMAQHDIVQVIRCCDCKWLQHNMKPDGQIPKGVDEYECRHWCGSCDPTDYCSAGERRNEDGRS